MDNNKYDLDYNVGEDWKYVSASVGKFGICFRVLSHKEKNPIGSKTYKIQYQFLRKWRDLFYISF